MNGWDLRGANLSSTVLAGAILRSARLSEADLRGADLRGARLRRANLNGANLTGANLAAASFAEADLTTANLRGARLDGTYLINATLRRAVLSEAYVYRTTLIGADLSGADLSPTDFTIANLTSARLVDANLTGAVLYGANLAEADLTGANLTETHLHGTIFADTKLIGVIGLESCEHKGPSTLDHRTLLKSGMLPLPFLRGCGLPETLIDYLPSLLNEPLQFYSCFISYSTKDEEFAVRLHADLQNKGVRCWFAPHDIQAGKKLHEQIDQAIRVYDKLLLVLSESSMNSEWVKTEIANARQREIAEKRQVLFPVLLVDFEDIKNWKCFDADTGKDSAREIREYFIPDFSTWKDHDSYQEAFSRLLRDLKAEAEKAGA